MNTQIAQWFDTYAGAVTGLSDRLWARPELAMEEFYACEQVTAFMKEQGFACETRNIRGDDASPNTLIARWGSGHPVIGILGEFDALPGLGNEAVPHQATIPGPGHACGHNLMAAGCAAAAAAAKAALEHEGLAGTIVYYGCPAEEIGEGKVWMAKEGLFDELDLCLGWHAMGHGPVVVEASTAAITNCYIEFFGRTAHAALTPELGRSALDAAELMNVGTQYLREHIPDASRIHYTYLEVGEKANIVPDYAKLNYLIRARSRNDSNELIRRIKLIAEGAAMMTETQAKFTVGAGCYDTVINHALNAFLYDSLLKVPALTYSDADHAFADELRANIGATGGESLITKVAQPTGVTRYIMGSTDAGDVSYLVPLARLYGGGIATGASCHHWAVTATTGMDIGHQAELYAAKAIAQCTLDACADPSIVDRAHAEFEAYKKENHVGPYVPVLPE